MDKIQDEFIGNGAHWNVKRVSVVENGVSRTVIHKYPKSGNIEKNIKNYLLILFAGLPTLSHFVKSLVREVEVIESEDLNQDNCDGYFVSPNTVRNSPTYANILMDFLKSKMDVNSLNKYCYQDPVFSELLKNPTKLEENIDMLKNTRILRGAESDVYKMKIKEIANFKEFLIDTQSDMRKASKYRIELYFDAFFFRIRNSTNNIEYKIADFDCIIFHEDNDGMEEKLFAVNINY